jgi:putative ABC transport system permease protein
MRFLPLVLGTLARKKARTIFTLLSILVAFVLYGYLSAIDLAFSLGVDVLGEDRLVTQNKMSLIQPLPFSYMARMQQIPGVVDVTHGSWFGGIYQDPKNFFAQIAVDAESFLRVYPEFLIPDEQKKAWLADRTGAIVGRKTAERYGWKVGDRIPIQGTIWRKADGSSAWEFTLDGIYVGDKKGVDETQLYFHYKYLDESRALRQGIVGWYILRIDDPPRAPEIAERIDAAFANSDWETYTTTEKAFTQAFANQIGDIGSILRAVMTAVFFTILLVAGNTMAQSVRERTNELGVLKTLGFRDGQILALVLAESLALAACAGVAGLALAWTAITFGGDPTGGSLAVFYLPRRDLLLGLVWVALLGLAAGSIPALRAMRLTIVDALRRV